MTDMSEGPMSDERQHCKAVAREWWDAHDGTRAGDNRLADLIMAERAGLLAERDALLRHYDAAGPEHNLLALLDLYHDRQLAAETLLSTRADEWANERARWKDATVCDSIEEAAADTVKFDQMDDEVADLQAKLAAAEARVAELEAAWSTAVGWHSQGTEAIARAERAEAAAGQMRTLIDARLRMDWHDDACKERSGCTCGKDAVDAALATDVGRDYRSPWQVAQACAAARDAALEEACKAQCPRCASGDAPSIIPGHVYHRNRGTGGGGWPESTETCKAAGIRALKVTP